MSWKTRYLPPDPNQWRGRPDVPEESCFFQKIKTLNLLEENDYNVPKAAFAFVGFRCDEGIRRNHGRVGAAEGPAAIRQAFGKLPVHKESIAVYDAGSVTCADGDVEATQRALGQVVAVLLEHNLKPIILGGGQELSWGHYQGIARRYPRNNLGIINFDAFFDMRPLLPKNLGSSGTPFLQIAEAHKSGHKRFDYNVVGLQQSGNIESLYETAKSYNTQFILADDLHLGQQEKCLDFIDRVIDQNEMVYVSLSMDVFAAVFAPGVSANQPLGLYPWHVIPLLRQLAASGKVIGFDIAELSPRYDIDHRTAKLAAVLIYELLHHHHAKDW